MNDADKVHWDSALVSPFKKKKKEKDSALVSNGRYLISYISTTRYEGYRTLRFCLSIVKIAGS